MLEISHKILNIKNKTYSYANGGIICVKYLIIKFYNYEKDSKEIGFKEKNHFTIK